MKVTELERLLLSILRDGGRSHGLEIGQEAERVFGRVVGAGSLYRALHRMEKQGWLSAEWEEETTRESHRGPRRRYYALNGRGAEVLDSALNELESTLKVLRLRKEPA